jgi:hypothetical protein
MTNPCSKERSIVPSIMEAETEVEDSILEEDMLLEDFQTLQEACHGCPK